MYKPFTIFLFVFCTSYVYAVQKNINIDSSKIKQLVNQSGNDTLQLSSTDFVHLVFPPFTGETRLVFLKDSEAPNPFKDILPILTLVLGIGINKFLDWLKDKKAVKKAGRRWVAEIRGLEDPVRQQITILNDLLKDDSENDFRFADLVVVSSLKCDIFSSLDKSQLLTYIEWKHKKGLKQSIKISNQVHGLVSILIHLHESLKAIFEDYKNSTSNHIATVNTNLQLLSQAFAYYGVALEQELKIDPIDHPRYRPILDLFNEQILPHRQDGAFDMFDLGDNFFAPLIAILSDLRHDDKVNAMSSYSLACINAIKGIRMEKRYWTDNITTISQRYSEQLNDLDGIANDVENSSATGK